MCVLHRGQVATVHEKPGYQEKWLSAGQCFRTSAFLKVTTSKRKPWGFSKSWTDTRFPPITVSFRCESARRLGTNLTSASSATSCPHDRQSSNPEHATPDRTHSQSSAKTHENFVKFILRGKFTPQTAEATIGIDYTRCADRLAFYIEVPRERTRTQRNEKLPRYFDVKLRSVCAAAPFKVEHCSCCAHLI